MGMLDDAIREHLDLKRRQGADPSEIAQLETEALGGGKDAEREEKEEAELVEAEESVAVAEIAADETTEAEPELLIVEEKIVDEKAEPEASQPTEQFTPAEVEAAMKAEPVVEEELVVEADQEPFEPEEEAESGAADEARDELEATPDFLEETPEHDRLWFERKPPRDFDF
jgi:hypothetical protein